VRDMRVGVTRTWACVLKGAELQINGGSFCFLGSYHFGCFEERASRAGERAKDAKHGNCSPGAQPGCWATLSNTLIDPRETWTTLPLNVLRI
jgi:hypothetical protein